MMILTSCASREIKITLDYCLVEPIRLSQKSKKVVSYKNKEKIKNNNLLYYCHCDDEKMPKEFKEICIK
jgi:hypothetical protein